MGRYKAKKERINQKFDSKLLKKSYYDPSVPSSYSGLNKFVTYLKRNGRKYNTDNIKDWLENQETYQLFRNPTKKFPRRKVITSYRNDQWDMDLVDMSSYAKANHVKYLLTIIDIFSRYAYVVPLRSKSQDEVLAAIKSIITPTNSPTRIRTDQGGEFRGNKLKKFFKEKNITHFMTQNSDIKSNYVERFNRTLKKKLFKYMFYNQTHKYIDILNDIVKSYNSTVHNSIQMAPKDVKGENEIKLWAKQYLKADQTKSKQKRNKPFFRFNINEFVRLNYKTHPFTRDFDQRWTTELFKIVQRSPAQGLPSYKLEDYDGEPIIGSFYEPELQKVNTEKDDLFKVRKILRSKGKGKHRQHFVNWLGWPDKFNSWVKSTDIKKYSSR